MDSYSLFQSLRSSITYRRRDRAFSQVRKISDTRVSASTCQASEKALGVLRKLRFTPARINKVNVSHDETFETREEGVLSSK